MFRKIEKLIYELGWLDGSLYVIGKGLSKIFLNHIYIIKYYLYFQPVLKEPAYPIRRKNTISIQEVSLEDEIILKFPRPRKVLERRFNSGARCFVALQKGELAGYAWLSFKKYQEDEVRCDYHFSEDKIWDFDVYVVPKYRIGFVFRRLWQFINDFMIQKSAEGTLSRIWYENITSLQSHKKLGAKCIGQQTFLVLGPIQVMFSNINPYFHISLASSCRTQVFIK